MWEPWRCWVRCPLSDGLLPGVGGGSSAESCLLRLQHPLQCSHWSPAPHQCLSSGGALTRARYLSLTLPPLPACLGSGFPLAWDFLRDMRLSQALAFQSFFISLLLSQVWDLCHVQKIAPTTPASFPLCLSQRVPCNKALALLIASWHLLPEEPKLSQHFLTIPLFICASCTPVQPWL